MGLLILFLTVSIVVLCSAPESENQQDQQEELMAHLQALYFMKAETMARQVYFDPSATWSHNLGFLGTICYPLDHGVWYAEGWVKVKQNNPHYVYKWIAYFIPDSPEPLYVKVGDIQSGDLKAALQLANNSEEVKGAAADGK